jgi:hypothetical protein
VSSRWWVLAFVVVGAANAATPVIHVHGQCAHELQRALSRERPGQAIDAENAAQPDDLRVTLAAAHGREWHLTVSAADESLRLERTLKGRSCIDAADAAAVIVERHLESIAWRGGDAPLEPLTPERPAQEAWPTLPQHPRPSASPTVAAKAPAPPPVTVAAPPPAPPGAAVPVAIAPATVGTPPPTPVPAATAPATVDAAVTAPGPTQLIERPERPTGPAWVTGTEISLGPAVTLGNGQPVAAASLEAAVRLRDVVRVSLWVGGALPQNQTFTVTQTAGTGSVTVAQGQVSTQLDFAYLAASGCHAWALVDACAGVAGGTAIAYASASGQVYSASNGFLAPAAVGVVARVSHAWRSGFHIALQGLGGVPLTQAKYTVDTQSFPMPGAELIGAFHLGWSFQ